MTILGRSWIAAPKAVHSDGLHDKAGCPALTAASSGLLQRAARVGRDSVSASRQRPALPCGGWRCADPPYIVRSQAQVKIFSG